MNLPRDLFLFLCSVLFLSPTPVFSQQGYNSGKVCAVLHSEGNFQGRTFHLQDHGQSSNLFEDGWNATQGGWNFTRSYIVSDNCELTACPETYFDGECQSFQAGRSSSSLPFQPFSVKCYCHRVCSCSNQNMERTSCAKAYLNGGCNTCNAIYTDLIGRKPTVADIFRKNVTALIIREGCTLNVFSDAEEEGDIRTFQAGVVQDFTGEINSYDCKCNNGSTRRPEPTPRPPTYPKEINVPPTLDEVVNMLKGNQPDHPGLIAAYRSLNSNSDRRRSSNKAYVLLLGSTGSGKSSAINLLFNQEIAPAGDKGSTTTDIHEFSIPVPVDELGIGNSELRIIDTPGFGDTRGLEQDAKFLATLDDFLANHEELNHRIPNVVLVFHKFHDNRYDGVGSKFVQMLAGIDKFKNKITDDKYSNVIFVFSHFLSEKSSLQRRPGPKLAAFKKVIENYSMFPRPTIITVAENLAAEQDLPMVNGYFKLPNDEYYPRNLFEKMDMVTSNTGDAIGQAIFRTAFRNSADFNISRKDFKLVTSKNKKVNDYFNVLKRIVFDITDTPVSRSLAEAYETMDENLQTKFPHSLHYLQKSLSIRGINQKQEIPKTNNEILELLTVLEQNPATLYLLQKLNINPPAFPANTIAGYGYHVIKDTVLSSTPFTSSSVQPSDIGYLVPEMVSCRKESATAQIFHLIPDQKNYIERRLANLGISGNIPVERWQGMTKPGYNVRQASFAVGSSTVTGSREVRLFRMDLSTTSQLTTSFQTDVRDLQPLNLSDTVSIQRWRTFFDKYGTHAVKTVYGGGSVEISINSKTALGEDVAGALFDIVRFGEDMSALTPRDDTLDRSQHMLEGVTHSLIFRGGSYKYHVSDLSTLSMERTAQLLSGWRKSLLFEPVMLTTDMELVPMSQVVKPMGREYVTMMDQAIKELFDSHLTYVVPGTGAQISINPPPPRSDVMIMVAEMMKQSNEQIATLMKEITRLSEENSKRNKAIEEENRIFRQEQAERDRKFQLELEKIRKENEKERQEFIKQAAEQRVKHEEENQRRVKEHLAEIAKINEASEKRTAALMQTVSQQPQGRSSCLKEGTKILLADGSEKPVELIKPGDILLDVNLNPTRVIGSTYEFLLDQSFYGFGDKSFFFTDTHLMVGPSGDGEKLTFYTKSKSSLEDQNPLMHYLNAKEFDENHPTHLFHLKVDNGSKTVETQALRVYQDHRIYSFDTKVYFIQVDSETGTYFANGYVCRHELPPLNQWPNTMASLVKLMTNPIYEQVATIPYELEYIPKIDYITNLIEAKVRQEFENALTSENSLESWNTYELMKLEEKDLDICIRKLYGNPMYAAIGVATYSKVGSVIAPYLDGPQATKDEREIARIQNLVYETISGMMGPLYEQMVNTAAA